MSSSSLLIMTFAPPLDLLDDQDRAARLTAEHGAQASGTPWLSSFAPQELLAVACHAGFKHARHVSAAMLNERYFAARTDDLRTWIRRNPAAWAAVERVFRWPSHRSAGPTRNGSRWPRPRDTRELLRYECVRRSQGAG